MCLVIWTVFSGERCGPWATCLFCVYSWKSDGQVQNQLKGKIIITYDTSYIDVRLKRLFLWKLISRLSNFMFISCVWTLSLSVILHCCYKEYLSTYKEIMSPFILQRYRFKFTFNYYLLRQINTSTQIPSVDNISISKSF